MAAGAGAMTRDSLRAHEDRIARLQGRVERWEERPDGSRDVLLINVRYVLYDPNQPDDSRQLENGQPLDHVWFRVPADGGYGAMTRLDLVFGYGRIGWYRRSDGSVDLGLRSTASIAGSALAQDVRTWIRQGCWATAERHLRDIRRRVQAAELVLFDPLSSATTILADLEQVVLPMVQANRAALATSVRRGKGRAPRCFADLLP